MPTSWTDNPIVADSTEIKRVHITELRLAVNSEIARRGGSTKTWTDPSLRVYPDPYPSEVRESHVRELRAAADYAKATDCTTDASSSSSWTNNPLVPDVTTIRAVHINELRTYLNSLESQCTCNCDGHCACNGQCCNCDHCGSHCSPH